MDFRSAFLAALDEAEGAQEALALIWHRVSLALPRHGDVVGCLTFTELSDAARLRGEQPLCIPTMHAMLEHFAKPLRLEGLP